MSRFWPTVLITSLALLGPHAAPLNAGQTDLDELLPVRGFAIGVPEPDGVEAFNEFIETELAPAHVNTLLLRVDYSFEYESHPELRNEKALTKQHVRSIAEACAARGIRIIPQINLLGHQSWAEKIDKLLEVYPQFDETPHIEMPEKYEWPNPDGLYCKSYCPLHPEVHSVVFALVDELIEAFGADAFHAGMDEVFYIADERCPRCGGRDPAELFAGEVTRIRNHLATRDVELWIWGDRLIDGKTTGIGMWEASMNNTHRAIDMIPKDVVIADWHYERADPIAPYFAVKGFSVVTCPWNRAEVARQQIKSTISYRANSSAEMKARFAGVMHTVWQKCDVFLDQFHGRAEPETERGDPVGCTKTFLLEMTRLAENPEF